MNKDTKKKLKQRIYGILRNEPNIEEAAKKIADMIEVYTLDMSSEVAKLNRRIALAGLKEDSE